MLINTLFLIFKFEKNLVDLAIRQNFKLIPQSIIYMNETWIYHNLFFFNLQVTLGVLWPSTRSLSDGGLHQPTFLMLASTCKSTDPKPPSIQASGSKISPWERTQLVTSLKIWATLLIWAGEKPITVVDVQPWQH